jgi:hypothetical protein
MTMILKMLQMNLLPLQIHLMRDLLMIPKLMFRVHVAEAATATEIAVVDEVVAGTVTKVMKNSKQIQARLPLRFLMNLLRTIPLPNLIQIVKKARAELVVPEMNVVPREPVVVEANESPIAPNHKIVLNGLNAVLIDPIVTLKVTEILSRSSVKRMKRRNSSFLNSSITSWVQWAS